MAELAATQIHAVHASAVGAVTAIALRGVDAGAMLDIRARVVLGMAEHEGILGVGTSG